MYRHFRCIPHPFSNSSCTLARLSTTRAASTTVAANLGHAATEAATTSATTMGTMAASNATSSIPLSEVPKVWATLAQNERSLITNALLKAQQGDWKQLNLDQKRALFYIAYGAHGPRRALPKNLNTKVFIGTVATIAVAAVVFYFTSIRNAKHPVTMSREWQEATNEYAKAKRLNPHTGISSPDYKGKGYVSDFFNNANNKPQE